ncbi:MAG TPA: zinc-ribbon domain-containing protein [Candidatus Angelobacter sp.]|nr:zinc-ribbon domain-containing protein [Candidatus Angelobacter sp.]
MQPEQAINRELGLGEAISKTFHVFRQDFAKYFVLYAVIGIIVQVATALAQQAFLVPMLPMNPTPQQVSNFFSGLFGALLLLVGVIFVVNIIFSTIAQGSAIILASAQITKGEASLGTSIRFVASKLLSIWAVSIIVGVIVFLGIIALIVPGIILAIMYSLALPVLLIEKKGVFESMSRSRQLVSHRWGKTLGTFLVLGIIVIIASLIFSAITSPFGIPGTIVNGILTALYQPLFPILLAVYYYSNLARTSPPPTSQMPVGPTTNFQAGTKFCPTCGAQNASSATFCTKCGAKLS